MKKPGSPPNLLKMTSVNNLIVLFVFSFSMFIIYRYIKSLEKEVKLLAEKVNISQNATYLPGGRVKNDIDIDSLPNVCNINDTQCKVNEEECIDNNNDDDCEKNSVHSEEIMKMIDDISSEDDDNKETEEDLTQTTIINNVTSEENIRDDIEETVDDDFIITKSNNNNSTNIEEDLMKKTNEELKKMLKEQGKNTKGSKSELVRKLME